MIQDINQFSPHPNTTLSHTCAHTNRTKSFPNSLLQKLTHNQYIIYQLCNDSIDNVFIDLINNIVIGIYLLLILYTKAL